VREMCDPACEEQRGIGYIPWIPVAATKKIASMVQGHQSHDQAPQKIDAI